MGEAGSEGSDVRVLRIDLPVGGPELRLVRVKAGGKVRGGREGEGVRGGVGGQTGFEGGGGKWVGVGKGVGDSKGGEGDGGGQVRSEEGFGSRWGAEGNAGGKGGRVEDGTDVEGGGGVVGVGGRGESRKASEAGALATAMVEGKREGNWRADGMGVGRAGRVGGGKVGVVMDPLSHFRDRGGFLDLGRGEVAEHLVPPGEEGGTTGEVSLVGSEEEGGGCAGDSAYTELRFVEPEPDEVRAIRGGVGARRSGVGDGREGGGVFEVEHGEREVSEGVGDAGAASGGRVNTVGAVVV